MRITPHRVGIEADLPHQVGNAGRALLGAGADTEAVEPFRDAIPHCHPRIEGRGRILHHYLDVSAQRRPFLASHQRQIAALEPDVAGRRRHEIEHAAAHGGLAAARLSDERERLSG